MTVVIFTSATTNRIATNEAKIERLEYYQSQSEPTRTKALEELGRTNNELHNINKRLERLEKKLDEARQNRRNED